jgi:hypothetical protein
LSLVEFHSCKIATVTIRRELGVIDASQMTSII